MRPIGDVNLTELRVGLIFIRLLNEGIYCYANCTLLAWLWMHLSRTSFCAADLGTMAGSPP